MRRSRSRSISRKKLRRRSSSRSKHSKKSRHRTPERKLSKYNHRSDSSSDSSSSNRYKSSSKYKNKRHKRRDSRSPSSHRSRHRKRSTSSSDTSSKNSSSTESRSRHRSSSSDKVHRNKPTTSYVDRIRAMRTPTPPKMNFDASMEFLEKRQISDSLQEINANEFRQKTFNSSVNNRSEKTDTDVIKIKGEAKLAKNDSNEDDPLFHQKVFGDDDERMEQWIHRFYNYRQKMFTSNN